MKMEKRLLPDYRKDAKSVVSSERTRYLVTLNRSSSNPGEQLYIQVSKLTSNDCLVPESLHLVFNLKVGNKESF